MHKRVIYKTCSTYIAYMSLLYIQYVHSLHTVHTPIHKARSIPARKTQAHNIIKGSLDDPSSMLRMLPKKQNKYNKSLPFAKLAAVTCQHALAQLRIFFHEVTRARFLPLFLEGRSKHELWMALQHLHGDSSAKNGALLAVKST